MIHIQIILMFCLLISSCENKSNENNTKTTIDSIDTLKTIEFINKQIEKIDADTSKYSRMEKEKNDESTEGAIIVAFFNNNAITKIEGTWFGEIGKTIINYYCPNHELISVIKKEFYYQEPIYMGQSDAELVNKNHYYFLNDNLIKWVSDDVVIPATSSKFAEENKLIREDFNKYLSMFDVSK